MQAHPALSHTSTIRRQVYAQQWSYRIGYALPTHAVYPHHSMLAARQSNGLSIVFGRKNRNAIHGSSTQRFFLRYCILLCIYIRFFP
jgi:hypothetical protein